MFARQSKPERISECIWKPAESKTYPDLSVILAGVLLRSAADTAMKLLKAGSSAVDAVEMAIKVLEDREITNAGYGSNLAFDGTVECDATVVDHHGRSGAVGAVAQIRNPVSLARLVLLRSLEPLTLRRVPPNLLVGDGAGHFAFRQGVPILPHDALVSPRARERWRQWCDDLRRATRDDDMASNKSSSVDADTDMGGEFEEKTRRRLRAEHTRNMLNPLLPLEASPASLSRAQSATAATVPIKDTLNFSRAASVVLQSKYESGRSSLMQSKHAPGRMAAASPLQDENTFILSNIGHQADQLMPDAEETVPPLAPGGFGRHDGPRDLRSRLTLDERVRLMSAALPLADNTPGTVFLSRVNSRGSAPILTSAIGLEPLKTDPPAVKPTATFPASPVDKDEDHINDTVGAIAVDRYGRISAGSSSGGIGMKQRGRVGPAALVGVGTAVYPEDVADADRTSVAVVTSGTGEHMATTMAAATCADRLYHAVRKVDGGRLEHAEDDAIMEAVIQKDFMDHPSVLHSICAGAIGILAVKKSREGIYLYFAHNTDSFAVASMHADDKAPQCVMSRISGDTGVAQGGRGLRYKRR
ncbi:MAG: hypothetical protein M1825_000359 [Sarcosagium campestre]|nr:MAG: hypothetical protein M1825_000359 [Sarcosagium campestre]